MIVVAYGQVKDSDKDREEELAARRARLHMQRTVFSERIIPIVLVGLGILTCALILVASTVLLGIIPWR